MISILKLELFQLWLGEYLLMFQEPICTVFHDGLILEVDQSGIYSVFY